MTGKSVLISGVGIAGPGSPSQRAKATSCHASRKPAFHAPFCRIDGATSTNDQKRLRSCCSRSKQSGAVDETR